MFGIASIMFFVLFIDLYKYVPRWLDKKLNECTTK
jgi:hypothetical protein